MAHRLEKFYSSFGGVDTRSNKLLMDKTTFRNGSKNFRYNFQDEIQKANGYQHKSVVGPVNFVDIFEYKFSDLNTGAEKTELLAVGVDGNLYRKKSHTLVWLSHGTFENYSLYYDEVADNFAISIGTDVLHFDESYTLDQLKTYLNTLAGVSVEIHDDAGVSVVSTQPAYLLDCVIENKFENNSSWFWETVPHPYIRSKAGTDGTLASYDIIETPFQTTVKAQTDPVVSANYEGISSVNQGNSIFITDGGFPLKYDGKTVYRAGMPKIYYPAQLANGVNILYTTGTTGDLPNGYYFYKFRFGFTDANGAVTYGEIFDISAPDSVLPPAPAPGTMVFDIRSFGLTNGKDFPVFAARVNGNQGNTTGAGITLNVYSGHNILPGMVIRQTSNSGAVPPVSRDTRSEISFYAKVTAVTETTITLASIACSSGDASYSSAFLDNMIINGYFTQPEYEGKLYNKETSPAGAFLQIFRTKVYTTVDIYTVTSAGPFYHVYDMSIPITPGDQSMIYDRLLDVNLGTKDHGLLADSGEGSELPRACKFLTKWQGSLVQLGRPSDVSLKDKNYPSTYLSYVPSAYCQTGYDTLGKYTEAMLCDSQSVYWADPNTPEGFPQDGLHEFKVETHQNDEIKAAIENKDALIAIKEESTGVISGDLGTNDLVIEILEDDIGISSHRTLKDVGGAAFWLDPVKGFYALVAGRLPVHVGFKISDYQRKNFQKLDFSKAVASVSREMDLYFCAVGGLMFVYDFAPTEQAVRNCWYIWERLPIDSMVCLSTGEILTLCENRAWKLKTTDTRWDFTDHKSAIDMKAPTAWLNFGEPTIDKSFDRFWVNSIQGGFNLRIEMFLNYLDPVISFKDIVMTPGLQKKTVKDYIKCPEIKSSAISFSMNNSEKNTFVRIQGYELQYAPDFGAMEPRR